MKLKVYSVLLLLVLFLNACSGVNPTPAATVSALTAPAATATHALPTPPVYVTTVPDAETAAHAFLDAWKADDTVTMYGMLTSVSRDAINQDAFTKRYKDVAINITQQSLEYEILSKLTNPSSAQVAYNVTFHTQILGDIKSREMNMGLKLEDAAWRIQWEDGLIMPELHGGNTLRLDYDAPSRGNIYDRNGVGVALHSDIVALGVNVGEMDRNQEGTLLSVLSNLTGKTPDGIRALYMDKPNGTYVAVGEITKEVEKQYLQSLSGLAGLVRSDYSGRFYSQGGIAPHVVGFVSAIRQEEVDQYLRAGYAYGDRVARTGIESWGDQYLAGVKGATLDVYDPQGKPVTRLAKVDRKPSQNIYTTFDSNFQLGAQEALSGFTGALVVMERDTGRVLALVSSPEFDPNAFEGANANSRALLNEIYSTNNTPEYDRATMDGYPLGSVFKVVTIAAALESGVHKPEDTLDCQYKWYGPDSRAYTDWTLEKGFPPSGVLTLVQGLVRSCDPWFYQMGYDLFTQGHEKDVSNMARAFGLGSKTGAVGLFEANGNIPDPTSWPEAVEMAIGQWKVLVNPLQVARFMAAVGNGGTLYEPQVIEKVVDANNNPSLAFQPKVQGKLPIKPEDLALIQQGLRDVVASPRGTAVQVFGGMSIPVYGKTGTAQNDNPGHPHAWFAGYTDAKRTDKPDIAIAVIAENAGEGADISAPIFRRIVELYFLGQPQTIYPWESKFNVTRTPADPSAKTPVPPASGDTGGGAGGNSGGNTDTGGDINLRTATPSK